MKQPIRQQKRISNSFEYLRWRFFEKIVNRKKLFSQKLHFDISMGSEFTMGRCLCTEAVIKKSSAPKVSVNSKAAPTMQSYSSP